MSYRLFFGIRPPASIRTGLLEIMAGIDRARWQDDGQLHLTLRYVGEVEAHVADDLAEAAAAIRFEPIELSISGCGFFERKGRPTSIWAGIEPSEPLVRLQRKIELACTGCGLSPEGRRFKPHITLARLNHSSGPPTPFLVSCAGLSLGPWVADSYILYQSHLRDQGSLYEPVLTYSAGA